jgi:hypothetical protein
MAWNFGDSFDLYATVGDMAFGYWDSQAAGSLSAGRFPNSRGLAYSFTVAATKTSNVNDAVHHVVFSLLYNVNLTAGTSKGFYVTFYDGATPQCTVCFQQDGAFQLTAGLYNGAVLATWAGALATINTWYAFEIEVVIHPTAGSVAIRKNGNVVNDFAQGGLNTRASANNYANKLVIGGASNSLTGVIDDFFWRSDASAVAWMGDIRCYARMPVTDVQAQFSHTTTQYNTALWGGTGIPNSFNPNSAVYMKFGPTLNGNIVSVGFSSSAGAGGTGHVKAAIFSDNGGTIGNVLATSSDVTNPGAAGITCVFPTPAHISVGQSYWVGIISDATMSYSVINSGSNTPPTIVITGSMAYASWPVSNPGGTPIVGTNIPGNMTLNLVPAANADAVSEPQQDGFITYVYDNNPGDADFYGIAPISSTPAVVFATNIRAFMQKSDAGSRIATVQLRSGATVVAAPNLTLTTSSWLWSYRMDLTDPATGAAWTPAAVNNAQIGPKVVA